MTEFEKGMQLLNETFGGKDNLISLATIAREPGANGVPRPVVRTIDAYYEDGVFYSVTNAKSNKMLQIAENNEASVGGCTEMFTANGIGENLGWALAPENAELRTKLRTTFAGWYDEANNEQDQNCCYLAIRLVRGTLNVNHWEKLYHMDFVNGTIMPDGGIY